MINHQIYIKFYHIIRLAIHYYLVKKKYLMDRNCYICSPWTNMFKNCTKEYLPLFLIYIKTRVYDLREYGFSLVIMKI